MNALTKTLACLALVGFAGYAQQGATAPGSEARFLKLSRDEDGGGNSCSIPIIRKDIQLGDDAYGCENDDMRWFQLDTVRSATLIVFESEDCDKEGGWVYKIRTYIDPITTERHSIDNLEGQTEGAILTRGVLVDYIRKHEGSINKGKLSCVRIYPSELPPPDTGKTGSE